MSGKQGGVGLSEDLLLSGIDHMLQSLQHAEHPALLVADIDWSDELTPAPPPLLYRRQQHSFHEIAYVDKGECIFVLADKAYKAATGTICIITPGIYHYELPDQSNSDYRIIWFVIQSSRMRIHVTEYSGEKQAISYLIIGVETWFGNELESILTSIAHEIRTHDEFASIVARGYLMALVGLFSRRLHQTRSSPYFRHQLREDIIVTAISEYIKENYFDPNLNIGHLARQVGLSRNYLITYFHKHTGHTPYRFLLLTRMEKACELLRSKNRSIAWIAEKVGFTSSFHFSTTFKSIIGVSPSEFRYQLKVIGRLNQL